MDTIASRTRQKQALGLPISTRTRTRNRQVLKSERKKRKEINGVDWAGRNRKKYKVLRLGAESSDTNFICIDGNEKDDLSDEKDLKESCVLNSDRADKLLCDDSDAVADLGEEAKDVHDGGREDVENVDMNRGSGRPKGAVFGVKRRIDGLDMWINLDFVDDNANLRCASQRTRSHFHSKWDKKETKLGTLSCPIIVDEEEASKENNSDEGDDISDDVGDFKVVSTGKKLQTNKSKGKRAEKIDDKGENPIQESAPSRDADSNPPAAEMTLPLKFTFGVEEEPEPPEKTEEEKELDRLWDELDYCLRLTEIDSDDPDKVEDNEKVDRATLCPFRGDHDLILDEQIGRICRYCNYVAQEIKDITLPSSNFCLRKLGWRDSREMNRSHSDELKSQDSGSAFNSGCDPEVPAEGTVWDIIPNLKTYMYPHQCEGFEFIWKNIAGGIHLEKFKNQTTFAGASGCIISHAPGTGKTCLTISFLRTYLKLYPTCRPLIIAPCNMFQTWENEFKKWEFDIPFHNLSHPKLSGKDDIRKSMMNSWKHEKSILWMSYTLYEELTARDYNFRKILLDDPGLVVLDEGHIPRNENSLIFQVLSNIKTEKRIILSGTPFQNNFEELYNSLCLARPKFSREKGKWDALTSSFTNITNENVKKEKLKRVRDMIDPFVHVHKGSILQEKLPGLRDSLVILHPTQLQKSLLQDLKNDYGTTKNHLKYDHYKSLISVHPSLLLKCGKEEFPSNKQKKLERLRLNAEVGVKTKFLIEFIRLSMALKEKVLVFSQHLEPLSLIMDQLQSHFGWTEGNEVLYMDGKMEIMQRQSSINVFNDPISEAKVLFASTRACSEGISLVGASRVVLLDVVWNPAVERQAVCRAYRLGQRKVVYIYHLIASGAEEEEKYNLQFEKDMLSELLFSSSSQSDDQQKISPKVLEDKILDGLVECKKLKYMFKEIRHQKKSGSTNC
ncbi:SNF2 domain-containing protein CLASSY 3-like [Quercus robur]|uniref:SNF2 domain-containing protein CLASSY 3-like n=1 Tax=Quercus robur TaxID=38942 RepID=UPI00216141CA|nr:SNF2 domain-containing protein CLASSY 3-like [Quercus robur]